MKKKYVAVMVGVGVGAAMAIGAPMAMAADLPAFPGAPGGEPNGAQCSFEPAQGGEASTSSNVPALTLPGFPALPDTNGGNCESFGNDQHNDQYSGQDRVSESPSDQVPVQDDGNGFGGGVVDQ